jgi:hypothetical protein
MRHPSGKDSKVGISTNRLKKLALICGLGTASLLAACGSNNSKPNGSAGGSGGTSATGGSTSNGGASAAAPTDDAGVAPFSPMTVTAYIDNITVQ